MDEELAKYLLDSHQSKYEASTSTPLKRQLCISPTPVPALSSIHGESSERDDNLEEVMEQGETKKEGSSQMLSCVGIEANIDEEEFNNIQNSVIESSDDTWSPNRETEVDSSSEEDETIEMDSGTDDSGDEDYTPYIHIRTGAALQKTLQLETLQEINIEDTVHDCSIPEATDRRLTSKKGLPQRYKLRPEDPRCYGLLSGVPAPSTEELLQHLRTCGDGKTLPQT
nr:uncharacterized protein LOC129165228 isoform X2 [Nothobranchius furzeri]